VLCDLGRLHFDLAGAPVPRQLDALLTLTSLEHLHSGSDFPFTPEPIVAGPRARLADAAAGDETRSLPELLLENSRRLFPALATRAV